MNLGDQDNPKIDARQIDLLVDGELGETQRRQVLVQLEETPGGWRRCALAFLEAQEWKRGCGELAAQASEPRSAPLATPAGRRSAWLSRLGKFSAIAASFVLALGLGWYGRSQMAPRGGADNGSVAVVPAPGAKVLPVAETSHGDPSGWRMVTLGVPDQQHQGVERVRLPVVERDTLDDPWLKSIPGAIPPEMMQALQQAGHRVQQSRQLLPVPLHDGRRLVVPVDQVEVNFVGNRAYQ